MATLLFFRRLQSLFYHSRFATVAGYASWRVSLKHLYIFLVLLPASNADAMCFQSRGYDLSSSINGAIEWLTCLHNEVNDTLNEHARIINQNSSSLQDMDIRISGDENSISELLQRTKSLQSDLAQAKAENDALRSELDQLKQRLGVLERK